MKAGLEFECFTMQVKFKMLPASMKTLESPSIEATGSEKKTGMIRKIRENTRSDRISVNGH